MQIPVMSLPRPVALVQERKPQDNIPQTRAERDHLAQIVRRYVAENNPVPPMPMDELRRHADEIIRSSGCPEKYREFIAIIVNNEAWREQLAGIPYERRLLMMPKCLRVESKCPAPFDEFGLLCKKCGLCSIQDLQEEAERLGYAVLVAEGSAIVTAIIQTGKIEAIVGVSCLSVLEKAFPHMESAAIPGIAIPLLQDDCADTNVDLDWVWEIIHLSSDDRTRRMDLDKIRDEVDAWFAPAALADQLGPSRGETDDIARAWLSKSGKRWRPFLTVCTYKALQGNPDGLVPDGLKKLAIAVECFHKASLIHDDIEDDDATRYGEKTLHEEHGIPVALNVGDYLIGEGYRLISECEAQPEAIVQMLSVAALGHRTLSLGQGAELCWARKPQPLTSLQVVEIFRQKTAPAFEVALRLGALFAGAESDVHDILSKYSEALGIAYQIRDDLEDLTGGGHAPDDVTKLRPSLLLAVANERARGDARPFMDSVWRREATGADLPDRIRATITEFKADDRCHGLFESYKEEAIRALAYLENASLKGLLRRVMTKIFNDLQVHGWCSEFEAKNKVSAAEGVGLITSA
jgi:geranylgeranyl pyrophosphate synthase